VPQEIKLFVRNDGLFDASADVSIPGESLGKWLIAREPKAWHNISYDSLFKFQDSYGTNSLSHPSDPLLDGPQIVSPRFLSRARSSYDFNTYPKPLKGGTGTGMALFPSPCASQLWRMDQIVCRPYSCSSAASPERADAVSPQTKR
jgi:hypothetical protein